LADVIRGLIESLRVKYIAFADLRSKRVHVHFEFFLFVWVRVDGATVGHGKPGKGIAVNSGCLVQLRPDGVGKGLASQRKLRPAQ
jgi:hypothetical protein